MHNYLLQILMETGIGGLLLAIVFLCLFFRRAFRLLKTTYLPLWQRLIFLPAFVGIIVEFGESLMCLQWSSHTQVIVMLFSGFTLVLGKQKTSDDLNVV